MRTNRSKRYRAAAQQLDRTKSYSLADSVSVLKTLPPTKFDQTVTLSFRLGVDPKQSDQMVRGTCPLPNGSGKNVRVLVFAEGQAAAAAREAGAEIVGYKDIIEKVTGGFQDFDVAIATPAAMAEVRKLGKVLGPRGLMPNPKTGTVAVPVGKFSFPPEALIDNGKTVIEAVVKARPATAKGVFVENVTLSATMSPGLKV